MKILLAVDGSKHSNFAVRSLIQRIAWFRDTPKIDLLYVHLPLRPIGSLLGTPLSKQTIDEYYRDEAQEHLAESKRLLHEAGLVFETHPLVGEPAVEICKFANSHQSDLIFVGSRGMGAVGNLVLGSTTTKILHLAKIAVVIVPTESAD
jgi:nucleotide-binding universal stress UspA family protein